jgi:putative ABC transport system ATP-binding protein
MLMFKRLRDRRRDKRWRRMLSLKNVSKIYGTGHAQVRALDGVDFEVDTGEFVSVMGPSGSGKSTLLNLLSALDTPTSGSILIDEIDTASLDDDELTVFRRRKLGLIFQFFNLLPTLGPLENVLLPVSLERRVTRADRERASALLAEVGLEKRIHHQLHQLSGGEMQRVAIARALIMGPSLILADEPTGSLDSTTGHSILELLRKCCDAHGATVLMVTHDRGAAEVGDRLIRLKDGRLTESRQLTARLQPMAGTGA